MSKKLWEASKERKKNSLLFKFEKFISKKFNKKFQNNYNKILNWSIKKPGDFWSSFWDFSDVDGVKSKTKLKKISFYQDLN